MGSHIPGLMKGEEFGTRRTNHVDWHFGAEKTLGRLLSGTADAAIRFDDLCLLLEHLGFEKRVRGEEKINLQRADTNAKPYQVEQVRSVILMAKLGFNQ